MITLERFKTTLYDINVQCACSILPSYACCPCFFYAEKRLAHCTSDYNDNITMKWLHLRTTNFLWDLHTCQPPEYKNLETTPKIFKVVAIFISNNNSALPRKLMNKKCKKSHGR